MTTHTLSTETETDAMGGTRVLWAVVRYPVVSLTVAVCLVAAILVLAGEPVAAQVIGSGWAAVIAVQLAARMVRDIRHGRWGVDLLALTAIVATVAVGEWVASLVVVLMLSSGRALESYASARARQALTALLEHAPTTAHRLDADGAVADIAVGDVVPGHRVLVRPAEVVPVDGVLVSDTAEFDESSLTGESLPVAHVAGDTISSGVVNAENAVVIRATSAAADSQYAHILAMVREAQASKPPVVRLADRYAIPFTAFAFAVAVVAWLVSREPTVIAEVLVVATPCPLLIAAPVAFLGGMSRAARHGIIVKDAGTLERLAAARTIAFDKTGTITFGRPMLVEVRPCGDWAPDDVLALAASAEMYSSHVLAASICEVAGERLLSLSPSRTAREKATQGVTAVLEDGTVVMVGKRSHLVAQGVDFPPTPIDSGQLAVYVAVDGRPAGILVMSDRMRADAVETMRRLKDLGLGERWIVSGDVDQTVHGVGTRLDITQVHAECSPEDKVRLIQAARDRPVVMVGDGVNDAPVLAAAEVGVAMGARGSTAASESADVVILTEDLVKTVVAITVGRRTLRVALQSIWIGIGLSVALILVAAFGVIPAVLGALSQELVDLLAILNALRALGDGPRADARTQRPS